MFSVRTRTLDTLNAALPPELIFGVELNDAAPTVVGTLFEEPWTDDFSAARGHST